MLEGFEVLELTSVFLFLKNWLYIDGKVSLIVFVDFAITKLELQLYRVRTAVTIYFF